MAGEAMVRARVGLAWALLLNLGLSAWSYVQLPGLAPLAGVTTTYRALTMRLDSHFDRRGLLRTAALVLGGSTTGLLGKTPARAESPSLLSDEYEVTFDRSARVGLSLADFGDRGKYRTYVKGVVKGSQAEARGVKVPALVVSVNGANVEGLPASYVVKLFKDAQGDELVVRFRDPGRFEELLAQKPSGDAAIEGTQEFSTQLAPETKSREAQVLSVKKVSVPEVCGYGAKYGDLLEIQYTTSLSDGTMLDSSGITNRPGRGGDNSLYFVLGQQPAGQFPKGWDLALNGCCVGERRTISVPPVLAYGPKGLKKRGIPPDSTLVYDITVIGINGNNLPR